MYSVSVYCVKPFLCRLLLCAFTLVVFDACLFNWLGLTLLCFRFFFFFLNSVVGLGTVLRTNLAFLVMIFYNS